jgi:16S rRNA (guanine966-N2)-methyltransferase
MSVIMTSGFASGIRLNAPKGNGVRPTGVRAKRALFDSIESSYGWSNSTVVDLFSGSGALGLEAASRGAARVFLIEKDGRHCKFAEKNIEAVKKAAGKDYELEIKLYRSDVIHTARKLTFIKGDIDIILSDPPYAQSEYYFNKLIHDSEFCSWAVGALLVWELPAKSCRWQVPNSWSIDSIRNFAGTEFICLRTLSV